MGSILILRVVSVCDVGSCFQGFLVVGGDLTMTRAGKLKVVKILGR